MMLLLFYRNRRSQSQTLHKTPSRKASFDKKMTFSRATGSFSKKHEPSLIASTSDQDFLAKEHSTFQMDPLPAKQSIVLSFQLQTVYKVYFNFTASIKKASSMSAPISLKDFANHVADMHRNKNHGFEVEYAVRM